LFDCRDRSAASPAFSRPVTAVVLLGLLLWAGCGKHRGTQAQLPDQQPSGTQPAEPQIDLIGVARQAIARNDLPAAAQAIRSQLLKDPDNAAALELSGDLSARRQDAQTAITMYRAAADKSDRPSQVLFDKLVEQLLRGGQTFAVVDVLQESIEHHPDNMQARFDLAGLATMLGMPQAAVPSLRWLAQHGQGDPDALQVLADPERAEPDDEMCRKLLARNPADLRPEYSLARLDAIKLRWREAAERLQRVLQQHPAFVPAYTLYGRALVELGRWEELQGWQQTVPAGAQQSADYWIVAGIWAQGQSRHEEAARAFWEALRLDETSHPEVLTNLFLSLNQIGRQAEAKQVAEQITRYSNMRDALKTHFERESRSQLAALRVAEAMRDLGRMWESEGWARLAATLPADRVADMRQRYLAIRAQLSVDTPWQLPAAQFASQVDLSKLPVVDWVASAATDQPSGPAAVGNIAFQDQARQRGWVHTCEIAAEARTAGHWIFHSVGGGVGVIDFDLDGWPDLTAAMLDGKPLEIDSSPNRLFRNLDGTFANVTGLAGYQDQGFAQGITIGDFNDDGFPDMLDANIGANRLFRNNGDGTFQEVSVAAGLGGASWTTSAVMADIDGDGLADLYEVNYCGGRRPYERPCKNSKGISTCPPLDFEAEPDRVWRGAGDGTFTDATAAWLKQTSPGRGLGVLAGRFDERPGLDLYIANDMTVNHFWSADTPAGETGEAAFRLTDLGAIRGLGFNGRSLSQASMGMAAGDPDQDGDIDFFLTHFSNDHNTYYEQVAPGMWVDRSFQVGLSEPSMKLLGFGTQWVDFDNNGTLELLVANGHVDDLDDDEITYRMPPQLFRRDGQGRWAELDREPLGDYFTSDHLGRAMASVDVDRDGRTDVAVTHLYDPASLLINNTENGGRSINLELKSTASQRDAIGAIVTMKVGGQQVTTQLTAGDGYMCSNQRRVSIGLGAAAQARDVVVNWPSGTSESFGTLQAGEDYLLIEGSGQAYSLHVHP
jgi:tetratricopeptide (TPR) repeat protein